MKVGRTVGFAVAAISEPVGATVWGDVGSTVGFTEETIGELDGNEEGLKLGDDKIGETVGFALGNIVGR